MKRLLCICAAVFVVGTFGTPETSRASTIVVDPGPLGLPNPFEFDIPFSDLNGTAVTGQSLSVEFVFADSKWISTISDTHGVLLMLFTNYAGPAIEFSLPGTGFFLDDFGNSLNGTMNLFYPGGTTTAGRVSAALYSGAPMLQTNPIATPFRYFGVHYDTILPSLTDTTIVSAQLRVVRANRISVPESTSSLVLITIGLGALMAKRWHQLAPEKGLH
jgi:hypothetical protein